jgi:hypothetical protein
MQGFFSLSHLSFIPEIVLIQVYLYFSFSY